MQILLVAPISKTHYIVPPIGLGYLASALRRSEFQSVGVLDCVKERFKFQDFESFLEKEKPEVVGFQVFSYDFARVKRSIDLVRKIIPDALVVVGGPHVSATAETVLQELPEADFGIWGEGEENFPLLLKKVLKGDNIRFEDIPGLIWRENAKVRVNQRRFIENLDSLEFPAWDLLIPQAYPDNPQGAFYKNFPIAPLSTSRGCPYHCTFCASFTNMGRRLRLRSIQNVLAEMELLHHDYGIREFHIVDDMFNLYKDRVREFCEGLKARKLEVSYTFPNGLRLNTLDRDILKLMKETGAYAFTVGIESGSPRILKHMKKELTLEMIEDKVNLINEAGLEPSGFFVIGYPAEKKEDIEKTIRLAKKLKLKRAHFGNFLPLPGTEATEQLLKDGEIGRLDWESMFYSKVPYSPRGMTKKELKKLQRKAFLSFHLRPRILLKLLSEIKSPRHLRAVLKRGWDYLFVD